MQSEKNKTWQAKDYVVTLLLFALHVIVTIGFCVLTIYLNVSGKSAFLNYFKNKETISEFTNLIIEMVIITGVLYVYFAFEHGDFLVKRKNAFMILTLLQVSLVINYFLGKYIINEDYSIYARPVALTAILSLYLIGNRRSAIFMNVISALMTFTMDMFTCAGLENKVLFAELILNFTVGVIAVYVLDGITNRFRIFLSGIFISFPVVLCVMCLEAPNNYTLLENFKIILFCVASGMLAVVLMMLLLPFFEGIFNIVTDFRLSEITSTQSKYMKELKEQAPGTFNHCITVATLAENCASSIGENALHARAAAYYHDLGKIKEPEFFAENQKGYNPHDELSPELSTDIIRSHARVGAEFIKERNLPEFLADVAFQHHGTLPIKYFYAKAKKYTENEVDIEDFSYPGPKPQTKIAAIIMICDACEAKVRTMVDRSGEKVDKAVKEIIEERMDLEQFTDCDITLKELEIIRESIVTTLAGVYHSRVKYPKLKIIKEDR